MKLIKKIAMIVGIVVVGVLVMGIVFFHSFTYQPTQESKQLWENPSYEHTMKWTYVPTTTGETKATMVFYGGAFVELAAYANIANELSKDGVDSYLIQSPFDLPILARHRAVELIKEKQLSNVYFVGHSLGGVVSAMAVDQITTPPVSGMIFLASYPDKNTDLKDDHARFLSISASNDKVLKWNAYEAAKSRLPKDTQYVTIQGGNHAGFGQYGTQKGDGVATITNKEQQQQVIAAMKKFILQ